MSSALRKVMIVSPHFPPLNTPDMHRVRLSLPYYRAFGWDPLVLALDPSGVPWVNEPLLLRTIPQDVPVYRVRKLPSWSTGWLGIRSAALRALPYLYAKGRHILRRSKVDLIYISTTAFPVMALGRFWKAEFGTPLVLDFQDPWVNEDHDHEALALRPKKHRAVRHIHRALERWTMRAVDGVVAVSAAYHETLRERYPWIRGAPCRTIPFGASELDFEVAMTTGGRADCPSSRADGLLHGVFTGVLGKNRRNICILFCEAFRKGLERHPEIFRRVRMHFVGTAYEQRKDPPYTMEPIAREMGLGEYITESPGWASYFSVLRMLRNADFLLMLGSDDPQYTASKVYPYILARRQLLALFHESSSVVDVIRSTKAGAVFTYSDLSSPGELAAPCTEMWNEMLRSLPSVPDTDWASFERFSARSLTRQQCELFDHVVENGARHA